MVHHPVQKVLVISNPSGVSIASCTFFSSSLTQFVRIGSEAHTDTMSFSSDQQITVLQETVVTTRQKFIADFDDVDESYIGSMTIEVFLNYIERQRLTHMPHRGSHWDKVLKWAEFFALQISGYATAVEGFISDSKPAARLIWTACRTLLQVGQSLSQIRSWLKGSSSARRMPKRWKQPLGCSTSLVCLSLCCYVTTSFSRPIATFEGRWLKLSTTCLCWFAKSASITVSAFMEQPSRQAWTLTASLGNKLADFISVRITSPTRCGNTASMTISQLRFELFANGLGLETALSKSFSKTTILRQVIAMNIPVNGSRAISLPLPAAKMRR